jgi:toxin FitB
MSVLLDINVLSELRKPRPNPYVLEWLEQTPDEALFLSALIVGNFATASLASAAGIP